MGDLLPCGLVVLAVIAETEGGTTRFELRLNGFDREFGGLRDEGIAGLGISFGSTDSLHQLQRQA